MSLPTRTDQKCLSFAFSSLWKLTPGLAGLSCKSNAVVFTAFCSSPVRRARLSVKVSAMRNSITLPIQCLRTEVYSGRHGPPGRLPIYSPWGRLHRQLLPEVRKSALAPHQQEYIANPCPNAQPVRCHAILREPRLQSNKS